MRMGREGRRPTHFHLSPRPSRKRVSTNTLFPTQILAVVWEAVCTWGRNNHTIRLRPIDQWRVRIAVATLHGIIEMSSNTHTHRRNIQIMIPVCSHTPPRPAPPITPKFTIHGTHSPHNQMYRILNAGQTRNHIRFERFSVSSIHIFRIPCNSIIASDCLRHTTMARLLSDHLHITVALRAV